MTRSAKRISAAPIRNTSTLFTPCRRARRGCWRSTSASGSCVTPSSRAGGSGGGAAVLAWARGDARVLNVTERSASKTLVKWDIFGARIALRPDGHVFTGAIYPMDRQRAHKCLEEILDELAREKTVDDEIYPHAVGTTIADYWLEQFTEEPRLPQVMHASTGDPVSLTVDHYAVTDWDSLTGILSAQLDVDGCIDEGWT